MPPETSDTSFELLKYILVLATLPLWGPFAKALWEEFTRALRPDGGLSGPAPTPRGRRAIEDRILSTEDSSQVHEPIAHRRGQPTGPAQGGRRAAPPGRRPAQPPGGPQLGAQRRAFASGPRRPAAPGKRPRFR